MIDDWGVTVDPRNIEIGREDLMPFKLFPRQVDALRWIFDTWRSRQSGVLPKSRDQGLSWLCMALSCCLCTLYEGMDIGFGSRKEDLVDSADTGSLFYKGRIFMQYLPPILSGNWMLEYSKHLIIKFPATRSMISGEAGKNIGRGPRKAIYFVDEAAWLEHPEITDAALSKTTNCRIEVSSVHGNANPFAKRCMTWPAERVFRFHWRDNPMMTQKHYDDFLAKWGPVITAQEMDIDFNASVEGIVIPAEWVQAIVNAHEKLGIPRDGARRCILDLADKGLDKCAAGIREGICFSYAETWKGKQSDLYKTVEKAFSIADLHGTNELLYDGDGMGASVRGDARMINKTRRKGYRDPIITEGFRGSYSGDAMPLADQTIRPHRNSKDLARRVTNKQYFKNYKALGWIDLRWRVENTVNALQGRPHVPDFFISLIPGYPEFGQLCMELSQPVQILSDDGKILIDKVPDEQPSPNLADLVMMAYAPRKHAMLINDQLAEADDPMEVAAKPQQDDYPENF